jgi:hypothetical protein
MMIGVENTLRLQAMLLADNIYRDQRSGKYILAGIFQRLYAPDFPTKFGRTVGIFISFSGLVGEAVVEIRFVDLQDMKVWMHREAIPVSSGSADLPVELAVEVPQMPLPHAGKFVFQVWVNGMELGEIPLIAEFAGAQESCSYLAG